MFKAEILEYVADVLKSQSETSVLDKTGPFFQTFGCLLITQAGKFRKAATDHLPLGPSAAVVITEGTSVNRRGQMCLLPPPARISACSVSEMTIVWLLVR